MTAADARSFDHSGAYRRMFESFTRDSRENISRNEIIQRLHQAGISDNDPRIHAAFQAVAEQDIDFESFTAMCQRDGGLITRVIRGELILPDFATFATELTEIYELLLNDHRGNVADYIPQLKRVDPNRFGVAVCTVDGQRLSIGDSGVDFCVQSVCKPINYCLALEEHGADIVHKHIGREPSGRGFNELTFNGDGLPHNPMINSGAIMAGALIKPEADIADRFDFVLDTWRQLSGNLRVGFNNAVYLSERQTADRNFALGYSMRENKAFPPGTDLLQTLEFYFQCCSIEVSADVVATVAASLANGGRCPSTGRRIFAATTVQRCLSLMSSCGMYDYSGEFAFSIGLPAKSGVSGALMLVIPQTMGICIWSPRLDPLGNSVRGVEFCRQLVSRYNFHMYDGLIDDAGSEKRDPRQQKNQAVVNGLVRLCWAAAEGDLDEVRILIASGVNPDAADYDGRTALHLAASEGRHEVVSFLLGQGTEVQPLDRWGNSPAADARSGGHDAIADLIENHRRDASRSQWPSNLADLADTEATALA